MSAPTVTDVSFLLSHAGHVLSTQMTAAFEELGVSPRGYCVLNHATRAELTQNQLAELSDLDKTTMVVTLDALEGAGLAERRPSATDRRARIVHVTEAGRVVVERGRLVSSGVHQAVLDALPAGEREAFVAALTRLVEGHLARPAESATVVRRARRTQK
ncbi:MarR family transcriptional regulator [Longispora fulva]|uniref:DNA-binding MarR family transcriptional regulator n=1 Tax=Longispora fulva TaxID=619741 RepID=A0A8J7KWZ6_9ACTN|nr:MarR family winged helix-turn-helix transcriptional regulator [Longispora fulva]MBG6137102.1 DNA-binding MarR family transcriptional regulator [Longispora fulva]GIG61544.1 MarR family transcriptional regulator [Longispora fulva]